MNPFMESSQRLWKTPELFIDGLPQRSLPRRGGGEEIKPNGAATQGGARRTRSALGYTLVPLRGGAGSGFLIYARNHSE